MKTRNAKKLKWKRRHMGNNYEWMLTGQHPKLVTALASHRDLLDRSIELRIILDPRTGKRWTNMKAAREWLDKVLK
jgi:hypothetical protein